VARATREEVLEEMPPADPGVDAAVPAEAESEGVDWYVIHTYSGYENKVKKNLEYRVAQNDMSDKIFQIVVPTEEEIEIRNGQRHTVQRKVFPGYVLVEMGMSDEAWYLFSNTRGVTGFVGMGKKPMMLGKDEAAGSLLQMEAEAPKVKVTFSPGQAVKIVDGPFTNFSGKIDEVNSDRNTLRVMVTIFGRSTPVELDFLQVEKI